MKILILSGGMHPFHQTTPILIHFLIEHGFEVNLTEDPNYLLTYDMTKYETRKNEKRKNEKRTDGKRKYEKRKMSRANMRRLEMR